MSFTFERRAFLEALARALEETPVVLVTAPRGGGKSFLLARLARERDGAVLVQLEPLSCSPEVLASELSRILGEPRGNGSSFASLLAALRKRSSDSLLLLDDVTEVRTLSYYPSVDEPLESFLRALEEGRGRCVLTSRFSYWMRRKFPELPHLGLPPLEPGELARAGVPDAEAVATATGGIAVHAARLAETMDAHHDSLEEALARELSSGGRIEAECRATLAELLHRARGYGACKTVLRTLAREEGLKLTEVARRLHRTAGSTRDYLRWLEEVDLIEARQKRFYYVDPMLRLWMRIYAKGTLPERGELRAEVAAHLGRETPPAEEFTYPPPPSEDLVEID